MVTKMLIEDALTLLIRVPLLCCLRITISIAVTIVGSSSGCRCCLGGKDVIVTEIVVDVDKVLLGITNKQKRVRL